MWPLSSTRNVVRVATFTTLFIATRMGAHHSGNKIWRFLCDSLPLDMYRFLDRLQEQTIFHRLFLHSKPTHSMVDGSLLMPEGAGRARRKWNAPRSQALRQAKSGEHRGVGGEGRQRPCGNNKLNLYSPCTQALASTGDVALWSHLRLFRADLSLSIRFWRCLLAVSSSSILA